MTDMTELTDVLGATEKSSMVSERKVACFPILGDYQMIVDILMEQCLHYETLTCPPFTKRTLEIGSRNSPDMVCTPFKMMLGNMIEAIEAGANVFPMPGAGCRLGFYDILQKQILADMGYKIDIIPLFDYAPTASRLYRSLSEVNPDLTNERFNQVLDLLVRIVIDMDELADYMRMNMGFELNAGEFEQQYYAYLREVRNAQSVEEAAEIGERYRELIYNIKTDKPDDPIRIGIIGELYAVIEPFFNCYVEKWLAEHRVEIVRPIDMTRITLSLSTLDEQIEDSGGYVSYNLGSFVNDSIAAGHRLIEDGIDGLLQLKPSTCSPEITAMTILQNMSRDYDVPIIHMTFDTETSEAGVVTRLEAFYDMLLMRRQNQKGNA